MDLKMGWVAFYLIHVMPSGHATPSKDLPVSPRSAYIHFIDAKELREFHQ